jgi:hypothetical protein
LSMEEIPCSIILSPPSIPTYDSPGLRALPTILLLPEVRYDPGYSTQVDNRVNNQALFVNAVLAWDTSILPQVHTTEALDTALLKLDCICMGSYGPTVSPVPFRNNVPPGDSVVCGIWAWKASSPSAPVMEYVPYGMVQAWVDQKRLKPDILRLFYDVQ